VQSAGFGFVRNYPGLRVERLYEEQAIVVADEAFDLPPGATVEVVPNHACAAVNLHEQMLIRENGVVVEVWPVDARGWNGSLRVSAEPRGRPPRRENCVSAAAALLAERARIVLMIDLWSRSVRSTAPGATPSACS
jgi:Putative serine dehydratase domain